MAEHETIADIIAEMRGIRIREFQDYADRLDAAHKHEVDDLRQQRDVFGKRAEKLLERCAELDAEVAAKDEVIKRLNDTISEWQRREMATTSAVGNAAKLRETLEYPKDANDKYIHIGDAVHMLNTNHEGDHEWDDVVLFFEYVGKGGGDDWLVYGEDGAAWACECEVLKQEGGNDGNE